MIIQEYIKELQERYDLNRRLADICLRHDDSEMAIVYLDQCVKIKRAIEELEQYVS